MSPSELLKQYVILHNQGVQGASFQPLISLFAFDSVLAFENNKIGAFEGKVRIEDIFRKQPPEFLLGIGKIVEQGNTATTDYFDMKDPKVKLGSLTLTMEGEKITKLIIGS